MKSSFGSIEKNKNKIVIGDNSCRKVECSGNTNLAPIRPQASIIKRGYPES